jgi:TonB family protein
MKVLCTFLSVGCFCLVGFGQEKGDLIDIDNSKMYPVAPCVGKEISLGAAPNAIYNRLEEVAKFKGGDIKEVNKFIAPYIKYTDSALKNDIQGRITIKFVIEKDGSITDVQVTGKKLGDGLDEVAIEAIKKTSGMWTPAKINGMPVKSLFKVPISFRISPDSPQ